MSKGSWAKLKAKDPVLYSCHQMCNSASKRSRLKDLPYNINPTYLYSISPVRCPVFDWLLIYGGYSGSGDIMSPSLDRIDPNKGYVIGNVQIISLLANRMKNDASKDELQRFAKWVLNDLG
jgi:hypothetical protein